jgi:hypothetical protein
MSENATGPTYAVETLRSWMRRVLQRYGMFAADAELVIQRLLEAELRGRPQGGVALLEEIATAFDGGDIDPRARALTIQDTPAIAVLDGSTGVGQAGATRAMQLAVQKAQAVGVGVVVLTNSQPCGDVAGYAELAAESNCIGFCTTNAGRATHPLQSGGVPVFADHPQAWAVPAGEGAWVACETTSDTADGTASPSGVLRGIISLLLTAGLAGTRLPSAKRKVSPYGAGSEHTCLALHLPTWQAADNCRRLWDDLLPLLGAPGPGWRLVSLTVDAEQVTLAAATEAALRGVATQTRIPWPA